MAKENNKDPTIILNNTKMKDLKKKLKDLNH